MGMGPVRPLWCTALAWVQPRAGATRDASGWVERGASGAPCTQAGRPPRGRRGRGFGILLTTGVEKARPKEAQGQRPSGSVFAERDGQRRHRCAERAAPPEADPGAESRWGGAAVTGGRRTHYYTARLNPTRAVRPEPIVESYVQLGGTSSDGRPGRCGQAAAAGRVRGGRASSGASRDNKMLRTSEWWVRGWISRPTSLKHFFKRLRWPRQHSPQPRRQAWPRVPPPPGGQASGIPKKLARRRRGDGVTGSHKEQPVLGDEQRGTPDRARSP
ncbi:unnamed protein product [Prorocentrum cordatum]|uniref:Uncharacterized protein n=1 Tax=Prorocentrum cordatum TaxID=2364126 RepID=A0ABN9ST22_9DINO|nr:unnamed protein product [Polarella glacialis]